MPDFSAVNYLAVLVATVVAMVIGMIWYSPKVFGNWWIRESGVDTKNPRYTMVQAMIGCAIVTFITAAVIAHLVLFLPVIDVPNVMQFVFWAWLGFTACFRVLHGLFEGKSVKLLAFICVYDLVIICAMGAVIALWR
jgi:hypothetical protein